MDKYCYRMASIVDNAEDAIVSEALDGTILSWNHGAEHIFGYAEDEAVGHSASMLYPPEQAGVLKDIIERIKCGEHISHFEATRVRKDGTPVILSISASPVVDDGRITGISIIARDITKERALLAEKEGLIDALKAANDDYAALAEVTANAISTLDLDELLDLLMKRLVKVTGADTGVILLKEGDRVRVRASIGVEEEVHAGYSMRLGSGFAGTIAQTGKPLYIADAMNDPRVISPFIRRRGIRSMLGVPLKRRDETIGVLHLDWTSVHAENPRELRLLEVTAERCAMAISNALLYMQTKEQEEMLNQYLDVMSHYITNKNQIAIGYLERALEAEPFKGQEKSLIRKPIDTLLDVQMLTNLIKAARQAQAGPLALESLNLCGVLADVVRQFDKNGRRIDLEAAGDCRARANPAIQDMLSLIIRNILDQAKDTINIKVRVASSIDEGRAYRRVTIEDNGPGIPDDKKASIFQPLKPGNPKTEFSEMYMAMIGTLVRLMYGRIWVEDAVIGNPAKGSRFVILLPAVDQ